MTTSTLFFSLVDEPITPADDSTGFRCKKGFGRVLCKIETSVELAAKQLSRGKVKIREMTVFPTSLTIELCDIRSESGQISFENEAFGNISGLLELIKVRTDYWLNPQNHLKFVASIACADQLSKLQSKRWLPIDRLMHALASDRACILRESTSPDAGEVDLPPPAMIDISGRRLRKNRSEVGIVLHSSQSELILKSGQTYIIPSENAPKPGDKIRVSGYFIEERPRRVFGNSMNAVVHVIRAYEQLPLEI